MTPKAPLNMTWFTWLVLLAAVLVFAPGFLWDALNHEFSS